MLITDEEIVAALYLDQDGDFDEIVFARAVEKLVAEKCALKCQSIDMHTMSDSGLAYECAEAIREEMKP